MVTHTVGCDLSGKRTETGVLPTIRWTRCLSRLNLAGGSKGTTYRILSHQIRFCAIPSACQRGGYHLLHLSSGPGVLLTRCAKECMIGAIKNLQPLPGLSGHGA